MKLKRDELLSNFAFKFNLRRYGKCCDKPTKMVKTGEMYSTPDAKGYRWCKDTYVRAARSLLAEDEPADSPADAPSAAVVYETAGEIPRAEHVVYEASFTLAEQVVTKAGITVTDVVMTAVALRGAARDMSQTAKMEWTFAFSGTFKLEAAPSFSAVANVSFAIMVGRCRLPLSNPR